VDVIWDNLDRFGEGLWTTVQLTLISFACAFVIGVVIASFRVSPVPPLRWAGASTSRRSATPRCWCC